MIKKKLNNGVNLIYLPNDKFKTVYIRMNIYRPMGEEAAKNALLTRVLKSGSKKYSTKQELEKELESLYGAGLGAEVTKLGDVQTLTFSVSLPGDRYTGEDSARMGAELLREVVFNPDIADGAFKKEKVEIEKNNLLNLIESLYNDKKDYAEQRAVEIMFEGKPYAIHKFGSKEELLSLNEKSLKQHYDNILNTSRIDLFVSGKCDIGLVEKVFDDIKSEDVMPENNMLNEKTEIKTVFEIQEVNQGKLMMGFKTDIDLAGKDYYKMLVMTSVFGSGTHSKLFCNVREKLSLAYYAYARLNRYKSVIFVGSGIEQKNFDKAKNEILFQLDEIRKGNVTEFELSSAKKSIINAYKSMEDEPSRIISSKTGSQITGDDLSLDEIINIINNVTKEEVTEMSSHIWTDTVYFLKGKDDE